MLTTTSGASRCAMTHPTQKTGYHLEMQLTGWNDFFND